MTVIPVNVDSGIDDSLTAELGDVLRTGRATPPSAVDLVNSNWLDYSLDASLAMKLKIISIEAGFKGRLRVYVWDYVRWIAVPDDTDPEGQRAVRWGSGVRCAVVARDFALEGSTKGLAGLAGVAANVTLSGVEASVDVSVIGVRGDQGVIPPPGNLTVEKFGDIVTYTTNIAKILNTDLGLDEPKRAVPQMIGIDTGSALDPVQNAWSVGVVWGLHAVEQGWQFEYALEAFPKQQAGPSNPRPDGAIAATYRSLLGDDYEQLDPDGTAKRRAAEQLLNLKISVR